MSWSRLFLSVAFLAALTGCGFTPLYAPTATAPGAKAFASVYVKQVPDRIGQQYRNTLLDLINAKGEPSAPLYTLASKITESREILAVRKTATATRANVRMTVTYSLYKKGVEQPVWTGSATAVAGYNIFDSEYATLKALENVRERAIRQLAENVRVRLGIYFHRGADDTAGVSGQ